MIAVHEGPDHHYIYANPAYQRAFGNQQLIGLALRDTLGALPRHNLAERFDRVFRTGEPDEQPAFKANLETGPSGKPACWYRQTLQPWRSNDGKVRGVMSFAYDVTEQVEAKQLAQQRKAELEFALDAGGGVGTWDWDVSADTVEVDERFAWLFGLAPEEARIGLPVSRFVSGILPEERQRVETAIAAALETGEDYLQEYRVVTFAGDVRWVTARGRCFYDADGNPVRFPGVVIDITDQVEARARLKKAAKDLARSEERRKRAMTAGRVGTFEYHPNQQRAVWDPMTVSIFGFGTDTSVPLERIAEVVHPDDRPGWEADVAKALDPAGDGTHNVEIRITRPTDVALRWIEASGQTVFKDGQPHLMFGTIRDITERKQFEAQLQLLNRELNHRVKNLFAVCQGMIRRALRQDPTAAPFAERLSAQLNALAAAHMTSLETQGVAPVDLSDILTAVLRPFIEDHRQRIGLAGPQVLIPRRIVTPLSLTVHELATNAFKHGALAHPDGALRIDWQLHDETDANATSVLELSWREDCGAPIDTAPSDNQSGFGERLIAASVLQMSARYEPAWTQTGLNAKLHIPLEISG